MRVSECVDVSDRAKCLRVAVGRCQVERMCGVFVKTAVSMHKSACSYAKEAYWVDDEGGQRYQTVNTD